MKNKTSLLILSCIVAVFALSAIQAHFIKNTYILKKQEILTEVKSQLGAFADDMNIFGHKYNEELDVRDSISTILKTYTGKDLISKLQKDTDTNSKKVAAYLKEKFGKSRYDISVMKVIKNITIISKDVTDTLYEGNLIVYKSKDKLKNETRLFESVMTLYCNDMNKNIMRDLECRHQMKFEVLYSIDNMDAIILSEILGLLFISLSIMLFVVLIFYFSLRNLIKQRKIAEIQRDFINNITHEFKTPLATLTIATETLQRKDLDKKTLQNTTSIIERQNSRLQKIFNQASFDSLLSEENAEFDKYINQGCIENCINDFRLLNPKINILSQIKVSQNIQMSRFHFNTVMTNLLENAVKYKGTEVIVDARIADNKFIIRVSDNGIGIPKNERKAIFDKFYRIQKGDIHTTKGLGLGLFYTKQIIDKYSGKIDVACHENQGVTFIISIPIQ